MPAKRKTKNILPAIPGSDPKATTPTPAPRKITHKPPNKAPTTAQIAAKLVGGEPLAYKLYPSGNLVVISPDGKKFTFTPDMIDNAT